MAPPKFPKFDDLVHPKTFALAESVAPVAKPQGLFHGLLGGDAAVLYQDATENPDKYDDQTVGLLHELVQGAKKGADLGEADRRLLDLATLDFASYVKPPVAPKKPQDRAPGLSRKLAEEIENDLPYEDMDVPEGTTAYWWL